MPSETSATPSTSTPPCAGVLMPDGHCSTRPHTPLLHFAEREFVIVSFWKTGSVLGMCGSCALVILICVLYEAIKVLAHFMDNERDLRSLPTSETNSMTEEGRRRHDSCRHRFLRNMRRAFTVHRMARTALHGFETLCGAMVILVIVTFNGWLILAVAVGRAIGYCLFSCSTMAGPVEEAETSTPMHTSLSDPKYINTASSNSSHPRRFCDVT